MLERYCDALVIGTEISGLITAAFLARRGLTVHVIDLNPYSRNDKEPDPFCVAHLHSKLLRSILGRLNIPEAEIQFLSNTDSPLQILFRNKRIDISSNPTLFYEEMEREFPNHHEAIQAFYEKLTRIKHEGETQQLYSLILPTSFKERRQLMKFVRTHGLDQRLEHLGLPFEEDPALRSFLLAQLKLLTYNHVDHPFAFQVAESLNPSEGEILSIQGGHQHLKNLFLDRIIHHDGAYRSEANIENILFKNGIVEGIRLSGFEGNMLARYVIWNTQLKRLPDYLPKLWRFRKLKRIIEGLLPKANWFTAMYQVESRFLPPPMKDNLIFIQNPEGPLRVENFLYIQVKNRNQEMAHLTVSYLMDTHHLESPEDFFRPIHERIKKIIQFLIPFSGEQLALYFPMAAKDQDENTLFPLKDNDFEIFKKTASEHPIYEESVDSFVDLFPLGYKTPAPNFYLTAPEILGSIGYEGKFMLGLKVTDLIWAEVEKEKRRAMKLEKRIA